MRLAFQNFSEDSILLTCSTQTLEARKLGREAREAKLGGGGGKRNARAREPEEDRKQDDATIAMVLVFT